MSSAGPSQSGPPIGMAHPCPANVINHHVSASGTVSGQVKVTELRSEGTIGGEFDAENIHLAGTVKNNTVIKARSLEVKLAETRMAVVGAARTVANAVR